MTIRLPHIRSVLALAALLLILPLVLAACGDEEDDSTGSEGDTEVTATTGSDDSDATAEDDAGDDAAATEEDDAGDDAAATSDDDAGDAAATEEDSEATAEDAGEGDATPEDAATSESGGTAVEDLRDEATWPEDQPITFADFNWDSVILHNRVMQFIIENGYGYTTESVSGSTIPMLQGLASNEIQATSEIWVDQYPTWQDDLAAGKVTDLGVNYGQAEQGWYVPTYMIEGDEERGIEPVAPDLQGVDDLEQYKDLFQDPESPDKGRFHNGVAGWQATEISTAKLEAYGLTDSFTDFLPGSTAAIFASLTSAYETGDAWLGYLWTPHWVFAQMDMTKLEEPEFTDECWEQIMSGEEGCAFPDVTVKISTSAEFAEQAPGVIQMMENYESNQDKTNAVLLHMQEEEISDYTVAAVWYLEQNPEWKDWVPEEVAAMVQQAIDEFES